MTPAIKQFILNNPGLHEIAIKCRIKYEYKTEVDIDDITMLREQDVKGILQSSNSENGTGNNIVRLPKPKDKPKSDRTKAIKLWQSGDDNMNKIQNPLCYLQPFISEGFNLLSGYTWSCKTTTMLNWLDAIGKGQPYLGVFPVTPARVAYLACERGERRLKQYRERVWPGGYLTEPKGCVFATLSGYNVQDLLDCIETQLKDYQVIMIDHLGRIAKTSTTDYLDLCNGLDQLSARLKIAIVGAVHTLKNETEALGPSGSLGAASMKLDLRRISDTQVELKPWGIETGKPVRFDLSPNPLHWCFRLSDNQPGDNDKDTRNQAVTKEVTPKQVKAYAKKHPDKSHREIAADFGGVVSYVTVGRWLRG